MDELRKSDSRGAAVKSELPEDRIDTVIREVLGASVGKAEPSPTVWARIQQCIGQTALCPPIEDICALSRSLRDQTQEGCKMITWHDFLAQQERYKDLLYETENYRLVHQTLTGRERREHFYCRALAWLGRHLVAWGRSLQERYDVGMASAAFSGHESCAMSR